MSFAGVESSIASYGKKAKEGTLSIDEMTGGTFTISNGGVFGSLNGTPIINPPQSAILGMHSITQRPVVVNGTYWAFHQIRRDCLLIRLTLFFFNKRRNRGKADDERRADVRPPAGGRAGGGDVFEDNQGCGGGSAAVVAGVVMRPVWGGRGSCKTVVRKKCLKACPNTLSANLEAAEFVPLSSSSPNLMNASSSHRSAPSNLSRDARTRPLKLRGRRGRCGPNNGSGRTVTQTRDSVTLRVWHSHRSENLRCRARREAFETFLYHAEAIRATAPKRRRATRASACV